MLADLAFAWRACRAVKSNAILLASGGATVGVGMGQVNRVDSARLAVSRAGDRAAGAVAASDAFFPFPDGLQVLADAGVRAVVQPGGSVRDEEVMAAARRPASPSTSPAPATSPTDASRPVCAERIGWTTRSTGIGVRQTRAHRGRDDLSTARRRRPRSGPT